MTNFFSFSQNNSQVFIPDNKSHKDAFKRITHLGVGAHQDDLEFMATHGILSCFDSQKNWFGGVTCTNGSGSSRINKYEKYTDLEIQKIRSTEQNNAASIGRYGMITQLGYESSQIKNTDNKALEDDLVSILTSTSVKFIYTHQPSDKHETHVAVMSKLINAVRRLPEENHPEKIYGCEVWRGLDWVDDDKKIALDVSGEDNLVNALNGVFDSQISGGKRYDLAVEGRKLANATFSKSHMPDKAKKIWYAIDLMPLIKNKSLSLTDFMKPFIRSFEKNVLTLTKKYC